MRAWMLITVGTLGLALGACGDDAAGGDTSTTDTSTTETTDTSTTETSTTDTTDTSTTETSTTETAEPTDTSAPDGDATSGRTVAGTSLDGIVVQWSEALELCSAWNEAKPLAEEKARKVHITLPAQARPSLDEDALAAASVVAAGGTIIRRGPNAADRFTPTSETTTLESWQVQESGGGTGHYFSATIRHDLGDAGAIIEMIAAGRSDSNRAPIVVTPEDWEVRFAWEPPGGTLESALLERCGGDPAFEHAVSVAVARDEGGKRWATLVRQWRTNPGADAGSYPVVLLSHAIFTSDGIWWGNEAWDYWSQTYVAQHHNWDDESEVDFARDLGLWHTFFGLAEPSGTRIRRVKLDGVLGGGGPATMTIDTQTGTTVTSETLTIPEPNMFRRVDAAALGRELAADCDDGVVHVAGGPDHRVQLMLCSDGGKQDLVGVVPIVWMTEPTRSSKRVDAIVAVDGGWDVAIGAYELRVRRQGDEAYTTEVYDAGGEIVTSSWDEVQVLAPEPPRMETIEADKDGIAMRLERRWSGFGVGKSQLWAPTRFTLTFGGVTRTVEAWDRLAYTNTHHNWEDELVATADDGVVMRWKVSFMNGVRNLVSATDAQGNELLAPVDLGQ